LVMLKVRGCHCRLLLLLELLVLVVVMLVLVVLSVVLVAHVFTSVAMQACRRLREELTKGRRLQVLARKLLAVLVVLRLRGEYRNRRRQHLRDGHSLLLRLTRRVTIRDALGVLDVDAVHALQTMEWVGVWYHILGTQSRSDSRRRRRCPIERCRNCWRWVLLLVVGME